MIKAIIFDHDGTLVDTEKEHFNVWRNLLQTYGVDFDEDEFAQLYSGLPTRETAQQIVSKHQLQVDPEHLFHSKVTAAKSHFEKNLPKAMPFAHETVKNCHRHFDLAVASGALKHELALSLSHNNLDSYFPIVASGEDVSHSKPAPDVYQLALSGLQLQPHEAIAIEDSYTGLTSAKAAGLTTIYVPYAYSGQHDASAADFTVENLEQAWQLIKQKFC